MLPNVLSRDAVAQVLGAMHGVPWLMASLLYGFGPRGVVHRTRAPEKSVILMVETAAIVPTGD